MLKLINGKMRYSSPPPNYAPIVNSKGSTMNLNDYLNCENKNPEFGVVLMPDDFVKYFR
jgi:hypothetical protein